MLRWLCLLGLVAVALAGTTNRRPAAPVSTQEVHVTSLRDKDNKRKGMEHAAFANAGRAAGLEIWRIEDFEPVPVPSRDHGKFYKGDSYIILKTKADKKGHLSWDIHFWLGMSTSQDEAGAAAILSVGLDDKFLGAAVQHREVQGHESQQFMSYFSPAIRYLDGGHASGFSHVTTNAGAEKRLFQIKGKRNVRVRQVDPLISSMNKGDCFILDVNNDIYVYVGENAKRVERLKAVSVANQIRDQDHHGRGRVEIIDNYSSEADTEKFFTDLGSGSRDIVPEESAGGDDQAFERGEESTVSLYEISDSSGALKTTPLAKPYKQEQLKPNECYILDTVSGSIYVWVGKQSTEKEKSEAMAKAQQFLTSKSYPSWVHVSRIPQGTEPAAFKQYFTTWQDAGMLHPRLVRTISDAEYYASDDEVSNTRARIIGKTGSARGFMPDNGDGHIVLYRIDNDQLAKVYDSVTGPVEGHVFGRLYQGDCYVLQYEHVEDGRRGYVIYYWLGRDSTKADRTEAAIQTSALDNKLSGAATHVRVPQGEEPKHFLKIFKGRLITLDGGKATGYKNTNRNGTYDVIGVRLFQVQGAEVGVDMRAEQVPESAKSLDGDDVFVLETPEQVYVWHGQSSTSAERAEAAEFVKLLLPGREDSYDTVEQGAEPPNFWQHLDDAPLSDAEQWRRRLALRIGVEPRLLEASVGSNNHVLFEDFHDYKQEDLSDEAVYLLDTADEVYVWIGKNAPDHEKKSINTIVQKYLYSYGNGRTLRSAVVIAVKQGLEPKLFQNMFDEWDADHWRKQKTYEAAKEAALAKNEI